jgi:hypothetical protein
MITSKWHKFYRIPTRNPQQSKNYNSYYFVGLKYPQKDFDSKFDRCKIVTFENNFSMEYQTPKLKFF